MSYGDSFWKKKMAFQEMGGIFRIPLISRQQFGEESFQLRSFLWKILKSNWDGGENSFLERPVARRWDSGYSVSIPGQILRVKNW